ncbi:MAG TPA: DUF1080 domain-containing protein [Solibacterales bacterium]|nr:DUF1080 domain-containing protein [Bryobacterales bacterium]
MKPLLLFTLSVAALAAADKPEKGFTALFNGKDLDGWTIAKENEATFQVKDGAIVANGPRCHLYYSGKVQNAAFKNFELKVDVMTEANSNGGIYFHTAYQEKGWPDKGFEVQVNNSFDADFRKTGSLYMVQDNKTPPAGDKKWFTEHIIVNGDNVKVFVDGKQIVDWTQPAGWTGPKGNPGRVLGSGTFALQGHDPGSTVHYKNIRVKPLK